MTLPTDMTISEALAAIASGRLTSEALVAACLARMNEQQRLNVMITVDEAGALAAAREVDAALQSGTPLKPLSGIPLVIKDNIHARDLPSTAGTPALRDFIPADDAPVVHKLRAAGAIVLGKTNMHELAFGATGYNTAFHGPELVGVRNPYDPERIAGGSSSGSAAALGARMALIALGTDTGGSMRIPCAINVCASLRPSSGRYPQQGITPISSSRDTAGPMALCMADVALLDGLIMDDLSLPPVQLDQLRLGVIASFWANMDDEVKPVAMAARAHLADAGITLVEVDDTQLMSINQAIGFPVVFHEAYDAMVDYLRTQGPGISIDELAEQIGSPDVRAIYEQFVLPRKLPTENGGTIDSAPVYEEAMKHGKPALQARYRELFAQYQLDALVFPTVPVMAPKAHPEVSLPENFHLLIQNTEPGASAGLPGIQLPIGLGARTGLPVGMELDGPEGSDRRLLAIGIVLEALLGRIPAAA